MANVAMVGVLPSPTYRHRQHQQQQQQQQPPPSSTPSSSIQPQQHHPQPQQLQQQNNEEHVRILPPPSYRHRQPPPQSAPTSSQHQQLLHHHRQATQNSLTTSSKHNGIGSIPQTAASGATAVSSSLVGASLPAPSSGGDLSPRQSLDLSYMHRPPTILPNYGKRSRGSVLPKSNVSRVLLYDNITQQTMLDVRVNSIRSQSYKINRELDMHMKSFISRRKVREKALKKITRVQHMDDYEEFTQEQQEPGSANFLPGVGPHKSPNKKTDHKRGHGKSHGTNSNVKTPTLKTLEDDNTLPRITVSSQSDIKTQSGSGTPLSKLKHKSDNSPLPKIVVPPATHDDDKENDDNNDDDNDRRRKVGVNFVESDQGVTRVFNIVTEDSDIPASERSSRDGSSSPHKPTVTFKDPSDFPDKPDENNNTPSTPDNNKTTKDAIAIHLLPRKSIFQIQKEKAQEEEIQKLTDKERTRSSLSDIPLDLHPEKPTIDSRYLHLQRLLVPQDPPNEGYAELSPSFPKRYLSLKDLSPRSRRKEYAKQRRRRDGRNGDDGDGEYSGDSDFLTDSSDEDDE